MVGGLYPGRAPDTDDGSSIKILTMEEPMATKAKKKLPEAEEIELIVCPNCGEVDTDGPPPSHYKFCDFCQKDKNLRIKVLRRTISVYADRGQVIVE